MPQPLFSSLVVVLEHRTFLIVQKMEERIRRTKVFVGEIFYPPKATSLARYVCWRHATLIGESSLPNCRKKKLKSDSARFGAENAAVLCVCFSLFNLYANYRPPPRPFLIIVSSWLLLCAKSLTKFSLSLSFPPILGWSINRRANRRIQRFVQSTVKKHFQTSSSLASLSHVPCSHTLTWRSRTTCTLKKKEQEWDSRLFM